MDIMHKHSEDVTKLTEVPVFRSSIQDPQTAQPTKSDELIQQTAMAVASNATNSSQKLIQKNEKPSE